MKIPTLIFAGIIASALFVVAGTQYGWLPITGSDAGNQTAVEVVEIDWEDLIPDEFVPPENPFNKMSREEIDKLLDNSEESNAELARLEEAFNYAPVVDELDGRRIKLAAYVTPLDFDGQTRMSEFLLVPYMGACIHTPPPPANQVVHAETPRTIEMKSIYDPVWAIGTLRTETVKSNLAESGYRLEVEQVLPYVVP